MHPTREDATDESAPTDDSEQYLPAMPPKAVMRIARKVLEQVAKHERTR